MSNKSGFLNKVVSGIKSVAPAVANSFVPGSGTLLETLMRSVAGDPEGDLETIAAKIQGNPELLLELQSKAMDQEVKLADVQARKLESVNQTMREESKSEHWPQYTWRPFNGFTFPLAVLLIYFVLPVAGKAVPEVPYWVWAGWLSILGVATWDRGKEKRAKAGEQQQGILTNVIQAIKG